MRNRDVFKKDIENQVLAYCRKHAMFRKGDGVVLGVSGGADSVCLLFVLLELQKELGIRLHVVHVNHGVREDAGQDASYVEELCRQRGIPFLLEEICMTSLAKELGVGSEEAGRIARYRAFEKACELWHCDRIAVAHNSNDRAETMLFHLFRGTGLRGMAGITPVRDKVVRPLLCLNRARIETYLNICGIPYRQDSTNDTDDYTRNRIRRHILPYAEEHVAENCVENMCRAADVFAGEDAYLEKLAEEAGERCIIRREYDPEPASALQSGTEGSESGGAYRLRRCVICAESFAQLHPVLQNRLLLQLLKSLTPARQNIGGVHVEAVADLFRQQGNRQVSLPYGIRARRSYDQVYLERREPCEDLNSEPGGQQKPLSIEDRFTFRLLDAMEFAAKEQVFCENRYTKWLDYDKIERTLTVRTRRTGDYLTIRGESEGTVRHKKLKDYMITEKVPREERDQVPLLADGDHVVWLVGYRISEYYKVTESTRRILEVRYDTKGE